MKITGTVKQVASEIQDFVHARALETRGTEAASVYALIEHGLNSILFSRPPRCPSWRQVGISTARHVCKLELGHPDAHEFELPQPDADDIPPGFR